MSQLPGTNGEVAQLWLERAFHNLEMALLAAEREYWHIACHSLVAAAETAIKAAHIALEARVPRKHHIRDLLSSCPVPTIREAVYASFDRRALNQFSRFYYSRYPDGEAADQASYLWCRQVAEKILQCVQDGLS